MGQANMGMRSMYGIRVWIYSFLGYSRSRIRISSARSMGLDLGYFYSGFR